MKHYFIFNPKAGKGKKCQLFLERFNALKNKYPNEIILRQTTSVGSATILAKQILKETKGKELIGIYACGGDGTMNEVLAGIEEASNVCFSVVPLGNNSFLNNFESYDFWDLDALITGFNKRIDLLKVNDFYALNMLNIGFNNVIGIDQKELKDSLDNYQKDYYPVLLNNIIHHNYQNVKITVDGNLFYEGKSLLINVGNGCYYGSDLKNTLKVSIDDGLMDIFVMKKVSLIRFLSLYKDFKKGNLFNNSNHSNFYLSTKGASVLIESNQELTATLDDELLIRNDFEITNLNKVINFRFPKKH